MIRWLTVALGFLVAQSALAPSPARAQEADQAADETTGQTVDLIDVAMARRELSTLVGALQAAGLVGVLQGEGPFTVFAPSNEAFDALGAELDVLLAPSGRDALVALLTYHLAPGRVVSADVSAGELATVHGDELRLSVEDDGTVRVGDARLLATDVPASNGVIHVIDAVVRPESLPPPIPAPTLLQVARAEGFSTLAAAVEQAGLADTLIGEGPFTMFAPTDAAFAALGDEALASLLEGENRAKLGAILTYHLVPGAVPGRDVVKGRYTTVQGTDLKVKVKRGSTVLDGRAAVLRTDLQATNGVIHGIDTVLVP